MAQPLGLRHPLIDAVQSLDELLPADAERRELESRWAEYHAARGEYDRLTARMMGRWDLPETYWEWLESSAEFQKDASDCEGARIRSEAASKLWLESARVIQGRPILCPVLAIKPREGDGPIRFRVLCGASFRLRASALASRLRRITASSLKSFRRTIAVTIAAIRDHCRSAIRRCLAVLLLRALTDQVATLTAATIDLVEPDRRPMPHVLAAGGRTGLHAPLN